MITCDRKLQIKFHGTVIMHYLNIHILILYLVLESLEFRVCHLKLWVAIAVNLRFPLESVVEVNGCKDSTMKRIEFL